MSFKSGFGIRNYDFIYEKLPYLFVKADFCEQLVMYRNVRFNSPSRKFYLIYHLRYSIRNA